MPSLFWTMAGSRQLSVAPSNSGVPFATYAATLSPSAWWRMGDASGNVTDSSGNARTLTAGGSGTTYGVAGWTGDGDKAVVLSGAGYWTLADAAWMDVGTADWSFSCALKTATAGLPAANMALLGHDGQGNTGEWAVHLTTFGQVQVRMNAASFNVLVSPSTLLFDANWHQLTVAVDRSALASVYIDGALYGTVDVSAQVAADLTNTRALWLGARSAVPALPFIGTLDEVLWWNGRLLTSTEAATLYSTRNGTTAPTTSQADTYRAWVLDAARATRAYYPMTEGSGTVMADLSSTANPGSYVGTPVVVAGPIVDTTAPRFDGAAQYATAPYTAQLSFGASQDFSIILWYNIAAGTWNFSEYLLGRSGGGNTDDYEVYTTGTGAFRSRFVGTNGASATLTSTSGTQDDDTWHMLVLAVDRDGNAAYYRDGVAYGSVAVSGVVADLTRTSALWLARRQATTGFWQGALGQVSVHATLLDAAAAAAGYAAAGY